MTHCTECGASWAGIQIDYCPCCRTAQPRPDRAARYRDDWTVPREPAGSHIPQPPALTVIKGGKAA